MVVNHRPTYSAGRLSAIFFSFLKARSITSYMKKLSIFVDESGDFGSYSSHAPYYIVTMVFHEQDKDLSNEIAVLNRELGYMGYEDVVIHTEPLIRREQQYKSLYPNERRALFSKLFYFAIKSDIAYKSFVFLKKELKNPILLRTKMLKSISEFFVQNYFYFQKFDKVILYYDNGQPELKEILRLVFGTTLSNYETRKITPNNYRLFQAADLICTLTLLEKKIESRELSKSEKLIFHSKKALKKDFLKSIHKKQL